MIHVNDQSTNQMANCNQWQQNRNSEGMKEGLGENKMSGTGFKAHDIRLRHSKEDARKTFEQQHLAVVANNMQNWAKSKQFWNHQPSKQNKPFLLRCVKAL